MEVIATPLKDAVIFEPRVFGDERGFFLESWNARAFAEAGLPSVFVQDNHSRSGRNVLRGMHFQNPGPQGKLVRVIAGAVYDAIVDCRRSSPTCGQWLGAELSAANKRMLWAPEGFAHGFLTLEDGTEFVYKCTTYYTPGNEVCLAWDDPELGIAWPLDGPPLLSEKDRQGVLFSQLPLFD